MKRAPARQQLLEVERAGEAERECLVMLCHELRTPLTPVVLTTSLRESIPHLPDDDLRDDLPTIRRSVERAGEPVAPQPA